MNRVYIDLSSIRENPSYLNDVHYRISTKSCYLTIFGEVPEWIREHENVLTLGFAGGVLDNDWYQTTTFTIQGDPQTILRRVTEERLLHEVEMDYEDVVVRTMPDDREYLFDYQPYQVICEECNTSHDGKQLDSFLIDGYDRDGHEHTAYQCPHCGAIDSFEEPDFETIEEALKRKRVYS